MFNAIRGQINDYVQQLPAQIPQAVLKSASYTFAVSLLLVREKAPMSIFAATASLIHGLMTPFFRTLFNKRDLAWYEHYTCMAISTTLAIFSTRSLKVMQPLKPLVDSKIGFGLFFFVAISVDLVSHTILTRHPNMALFFTRSTDIAPVYVQ